MLNLCLKLTEEDQSYTFGLFIVVKYISHFPSVAVCVTIVVYGLIE